MRTTDDAATVMVVDDDRDFLTLTKGVLENAGYNVDVRTKAPTWEDLSRSDPVVVYLDIALEAENGMDVCRAIKQHREWSELPVILISGRDEARLKKESASCKADGYLTKPLSRALLLQLAAHFATKHSRRRTSVQGS